MATAAAVVVPSHMRCVPGSVNIPVGRFPTVDAKQQQQQPRVASAEEPAKAAADFVTAFNELLRRQDYASLARSFVDEGYWRDHLALTWSFRTAQSPASIQTFLEGSAESRDGFRLQSLAVDVSTAARSPRSVPLDPAGTVSGVQFFVTVNTVIGTGTGVARLAQQDGQWRLFTLYTRLEQIRGHEEAVDGFRSKGVEHGGKPGRKNWAERREDDAAFANNEDPAVVVVGESTLPSVDISPTDTETQALARLA